MTLRSGRRPIVAIIGGGLCGAAAAYHLAETVPAGSLRTLVVEPRATLGMGLAYSTPDSAHRINVPASKMTLRTDTPQHFVDWLSRPEGPWMSAGTATLQGELFPERSIFGQYIADHVRPHLASGAIEHLRVRAMTAQARGAAYHIALSDGSDILADALVIATSHPLPSPPKGLRAVSGAASVVVDPFDAERIAGIGPRDRVLIIGAALTAADVVASLDRRGHYGPILALSRHGLRSRGHGPVQRDSSADFAHAPSRTARALLQRIRDAVEQDSRDGLTWHAAIDVVRAQAPKIWAALPPVERCRLMRHLYAYWSVHRFRIAPQVEEVIDRRLKSRTLSVIAARLTGASEIGGRIAASWRPRHGLADLTEAFDAIVVATGPDHGDLFRSNPFIAALGRAGLVRPDPMGLGLSVDAEAQAIGARAATGGPILVCGPLARGEVGELMGVPEVTAHAELVARQLSLWLEESSRDFAKVSQGRARA